MTESHAKRKRIPEQAHRFELASGDMRDVAAAAAWLADAATRLPADVARVVEAGIAVVYARPFTSQGVGSLDRKKYGPTDPELRTLHDRLIDLRDRLHAHTDRSPLRFIAENVHDILGVSVSTFEIQPSSSIEMTVETIPRAVLENIARLGTEQSRRFADAAGRARLTLGATLHAGATERVMFSAPAPTMSFGDEEDAR